MEQRDCGQHRDRRYDNGRCGLGGSPAGQRHFASAPGRYPLSFVTVPPPALTGRPGPGQAESLCLLWAQQSERMSSHGRLRPQVWTDFCMFFHKAAVCLCVKLFFVLQPQFSRSGDGQRGGKPWSKVPHLPILVWWAKWGQTGTVPSFPWPHFPSRPICCISMCNRLKSKRPVSLSSNTSPGTTRPNSVIHHL